MPDTGMEAAWITTWTELARLYGAPDPEAVARGAMKQAIKTLPSAESASTILALIRFHSQEETDD